MRNYKIVRIAGIHYLTPMKAFYSANPSLLQKSYAEQQKALFTKAYTYGDSFSQAMRKLGQEAEEIVYDFEPLQKTWAKEKGISYRSSYWQWDILLSQIQDLRPDILFFQDLHSLPFSIRQTLKEKFPFLKLIAIFRGFPGTHPQLFKELALADVLLVGSPVLQRKCQEEGLSPHLVYHYFDETLLSKQPSQSTTLHPFTFIGSSGYGYGKDHEPRYQALLELLERTELEIWADEGGQKQFRPPQQVIKDFLRSATRLVLQTMPPSTLSKLGQISSLPLPLKNVIRELQTGTEGAPPSKPLQELFAEKCHPPVFGLDMYQVLAQSKVTFNKHTAPATGTVDNIRLFQATGVGTCLLTDFGDNIRDLFEPDREVVTYQSIDECIEKAHYLLNNEKVRKEIALNGQKKTLTCHTAIERCKQMDAIFQKALGERSWE